MPRPRPVGPQLVKHRGVWAICWWDDGRRRLISTGTAIEARARQALADHEAELERHPLKLSVVEALARYERSRAGKIQAADRLHDAAGALNASLGHFRVDQVTQARWDTYAAERVTRPRPRQVNHVPKPVSTGTLRREFNVLRAALRLAWKDGYLPRPPSLEAPADSAPRDRFLSREEARRLIDAAKSPHVRVFVALAVSTGARKGSILSLTWDQVDFARGMVDFQEPGRVLTGKRRACVPMTELLRTTLVDAHKIRQSDYVVEYGGGPVPTGLRWSFRKLCVAAEIGWQPTPHHLKHSVASWFAMAGVPIDQAADWLATDPRTLRRTYRKFDPTYLRSVTGALEL